MGVARGCGQRAIAQSQKLGQTEAKGRDVRGRVGRTVAGGTESEAREGGIEKGREGRGVRAKATAQGKRRARDERNLGGRCVIRNDHADDTISPSDETSCNTRPMRDRRSMRASWLKKRAAMKSGMTTQTRGSKMSRHASAAMT